MNSSGIAAVCSTLILFGCGPHGTPDPQPRPQTIAEYNAAFEAATGDPTEIPMLLREAKLRALDNMGGKAGPEDFKGSPDQDPALIQRWRETGMAYFNAPFGTVEERRAWEAYMRAIHDPRLIAQSQDVTREGEQKREAAES